MKPAPRPPRRWLLAALLLHRATTAGGDPRDSRVRVRRPDEYHGESGSPRKDGGGNDLDRGNANAAGEARQRYRRAEDEEEEAEQEEEAQEQEAEEEEDEEEEEEDEEVEEEEEEEDEEDEEDEEEEENEEEQYDDNVDDNDDDDDGYNPEYMSYLVEKLLGSGASISDYHLQFSTCTAIEGTQNKNYRSTTRGYRYATHSYLHFHSCKNNENDAGYFGSHFWGSFMCHRVSHVVRLDDFFRATGDCVKDYCDRCDANCEDYGGSYCNDRCLDRCQSYYEITGGTMDYRGCAGPYNATDANEYYLGPACSQGGGVAKGYFLDEDCEIDAFSVGNIQFDSSEAPSSLDTFKFVDSICTSCTVEDVCENLYDSSFHCLDRSMTALAMGQDTSWQPTQHSEDDEGDPDEEKQQQLEFADEVCYKTSTYNQKSQYQVHGGAGTYTGTFQQRVINFLMAIGIAIMSVGSMGFLALSYKYHTENSSNGGGGTDRLCSVSTTETEDSEIIMGEGHHQASHKPPLGYHVDVPPASHHPPLGYHVDVPPASHHPPLGYHVDVELITRENKIPGSSTRSTLSSPDMEYDQDQRRAIANQTTPPREEMMTMPPSHEPFGYVDAGIMMNEEEIKPSSRPPGNSNG